MTTSRAALDFANLSLWNKLFQRVWVLSRTTKDLSRDVSPKGGDRGNSRQELGDIFTERLDWNFGRICPAGSCGSTEILPQLIEIPSRSPPEPRTFLGRLAPLRKWHPELPYQKPWTFKGYSVDKDIDSVTASNAIKRVEGPAAEQ